MYLGRMPRRLRSSSADGKRIDAQPVIVERNADRIYAEPVSRLSEPK